VQAFEGDLIDAEWAILPSYLLLRRQARKREWPMRRLSPRSSARCIPSRAYSQVGSRGTFGFLLVDTAALVADGVTDYH